MRNGIRRELGRMALGIGGLAWLGGRRGVALGAAAVGVSMHLAALEPGPSFRGQAAVVTGGSRGLGLAIALALAREGARVSLLARDATELARARERILAKVPNASVYPFVCDVTDRDRAARVIRDAAGAMGGIDLLVNNAGAILVGPLETMDREDYDALLDLHFHAVRECVNAALPFLRTSHHRRIVNVCSMGGKVAVPHLVPYDVSKFALAGYSQGLYAEVAREGISVTTVFPTVMRTGSPIQAVFKGDHEREFAWFASGDLAPGLSLSASVSARKILRAARRRDTELVPSVAGRLRNLAAAFFPETMNSLLAAGAAFLPKGSSREARTGAESRAYFDRKPWFAPLRLAARATERRWNQEARSSAAFKLGRG